MNLLINKDTKLIVKIKEFYWKIVNRFPFYISSLIFATIFFIFWVIFFGWYISQEPAMFSVKDEIAKYSKENNLLNSTNKGIAVSITFVKVVDVLLNKPGGYLSNDILPPGIFLDNIPNWEKGVILMVRTLIRSLRQDMARSQSQSTEDIDLTEAEPKFNYDPNKWIFPSTEDEYKKGLEKVKKYIVRLSNSNIKDNKQSKNADQNSKTASFYARADNLKSYLNDVSSRLGSISQRLSASVGDFQVSKKTKGDLESDNFHVDKTSWFELDDIFYEARGTTWALVHFLKAVEIDFADVLENKNATVSLKQIIRELEGSQQFLWSPMILNGSGFGIVANHSLVMANYISRANASLIDLMNLLIQG